ncbi:MAG: hypothetical protein ACRDHX_05575 [Chloroflexota bacterium]
MAATTTEKTLSEFLQHSGRLLPGIEQRDLILRRRDGDDVVISSKRYWDALRTTLSLLLRLASGGNVADAIPWFGFLSKPDQTACLREVFEATNGGLETGQLGVLGDVLYAWQATALANWDDRQRQLAGVDGVDDPRSLPRPA